MAGQFEIDHDADMHDDEYRNAYLSAADHLSAVDIIARLTHEIDYAQGILIEDALCAMEDARDEIVRLRGELENVQRDRMAQVEVERLRELITEWVDAYADAQWNPIPAAHHRLHAADTALREEANR